MSRYEATDARGDGRADRTDRDGSGGARPTVPMDRLALPRGLAREVVRVRQAVYRLRESEARTLATVGAFRVVRASDLQPVRTSRDLQRGDLRALAAQGLVEVRTVEINRAQVPIAILTREGKALLDRHRVETPGRHQEFHAGLVKPRELAHDAQLYRLFQAEASRIEAEGGRVTRVVLDYELKRDYQVFLNRVDRAEDRADDLATFAVASGLPIVDGHLELPDLRIEYETADGRLDARDVELVTEHYSRSQLAGKSAAGFALYRASGAGARRGGTPFDPHYLERLA